MTEKLSTQPYKGSRDFYPEDFRVREYIFSVWRDVCKSYGYEEYDGPFLESFDIYAAKSGEELVNEQLYSFEDKGGRKIAIRPEMTPTVARMIAAKYKELTKPIRWFSIANFWRFEKPQRGRGREFFQMNIDMFGPDNVRSDFELIMTSIDIMRKFGAKEGQFELRVNDRRLMTDFYLGLGLTSNQVDLVNKAIDKKEKISKEDFEEMLKDANLKNDQIENVLDFLKNPNKKLDELEKNNSEGAKNILKILGFAKNSGVDDFVKFNPSIVRGLDYYTGTVYEMYDLNPENNRAIFGGGRYDDLVTTFISEKIPAVGYAMGDITLLNFLEGWNLLPKFENEVEYFITRWPSEDIKFDIINQKIADKLRQSGRNTAVWPDNDTKLGKQLNYANKKEFKKVIILGENELEENELTIKDMESGEQVTKPLSKFYSGLK